MRDIFKYITILILGVLFLSATTQAQHIAKAEKKYQNLGYMNAVESYKKAGAPTDAKSLRQIANALLKNGDYTAAADYFKQLVNTQPIAEDKLHYAQCLLATGKCADAISWFSQYKLEAGTAAENTSFIQDCSELKALQKKNIKIKHLEGLNTDKSDFAATPYNGGIVFTSTRDENQKCKDNWTGQGYSDIYFAVLSGDKAAKILPILGETNDRFHDGTACFNKEGNTMFFTRSSAFKEDDGIRNLNLYSTNKVAGDWSTPIKLAINEANYSSAHPTQSADGNILYFASDRPGGKGGMDIWRSDWKNNSWSEPKNIKEINTPGNEIFPYVNAENELFFSSNGRNGLGGLDIFKYDGKEIENLGAPLNSSFDDFSYVELNEEKGYLSSNRKGGLGGDDDIYEWNAIPDKELEKEKTLAQKMEELRIKEKELELEKDKFKVMNQELAEKLKKDCGAEVKPKTQKVKIEVMDASSDSPLILPQVTIFQKQQQIISAQKNQFEIEVDPASTYTFKVENEGYETSTVSIEGSDLILNPSYNINLLKNNAPVFDGKLIKKGKTITIDDIYYDFNKYDIRPEATPGLDRLAKAMLKYPSLELELSSHTDCRGKAESNEKLSQMRAEEAINYLISKGVAARRMIARGYGESKPVNNCIDGISCMEEEHQKNRRTEIKILRIETEDLEVIKGNN